MRHTPEPTAAAQLPEGRLTPAGSIGIAVDRKLGFVHVVGHSFWSLDYIRSHFDALERLVKEMRGQTPRIRTLVDLTGAPVQSSDTAEHVKLATARIYQGTDQVALVQQSALLTMQMRRIVDDENCRIFGSVDEALAWLEVDLKSVDCSTVR